MHLERLPEFSIFLDQRPGELAGLLDMLRAERVTLEALAVSDHQGRGLVRLIGNPVEAIRRVGESLTERGLGPVIESEVMAINLEERPSVLRDLTGALADQGFNVRYAYLIRSRPGTPTRCALRVDELDQACEKIRAMDWPGDGNGGPA